MCNETAMYERVMPSILIRA